ncbi:MAG: transcription antitermination factor NusB [Ruminococcus sp.]|nr:transcription antitermination factor NusB [Ruminococcus sp.]
MAAKRRDVRESAFIISFEALFRDDTVDELFESASEIDNIILNDEVKKVVEGIIGKKDELDGYISKYSNKRALSRIPKINLAILRLAVYEALYDDKVPVNVAISEAVALAEKYSYDQDIAFINGVLGSFSKEIGGKENG